MEFNESFLFAFEVICYAAPIIAAIIGLLNPKSGDDEKSTEDAVVVSKRKTLNSDHSKSQYFVTFEFPLNNRRVEFEVDEEKYELMFEDDRGELDFKGYTYIKFVRKI